MKLDKKDKKVNIKGKNKALVENNDNDQIIILDGLHRADLYSKIRQIYKRNYHQLSWESFKSELKVVPNFFIFINLYTIGLIILSTILTWLFVFLNLSVQFHVSTFALTIINPLTFLMTNNFNRAQRIFQAVASIKAYCFIKALLVRDLRYLIDMHQVRYFEIINKIQQTLASIAAYMVFKDQKKLLVAERAFYENVSDLNKLLRIFMEKNYEVSLLLAQKFITGIMGLQNSFETIRYIKNYRSSRSIRIFTRTMTYVIFIMNSFLFVEASRDPITHEPQLVNALSLAICSSYIYGNLQFLQDQQFDPFGKEKDKVNGFKLLKWSSTVFNSSFYEKSYNYTDKIISDNFIEDSRIIDSDSDTTFNFKIVNNNNIREYYHKLVEISEKKIKLMSEISDEKSTKNIQTSLPTSSIRLTPEHNVILMER